MNRHQESKKIQNAACKKGNICLSVWCVWTHVQYWYCLYDMYFFAGYFSRSFNILSWEKLPLNFRKWIHLFPLCLNFQMIICMDISFLWFSNEIKLKFLLTEEYVIKGYNWWYIGIWALLERLAFTAVALTKPGRILRSRIAPLNRGPK